MSAAHLQVVFGNNVRTTRLNSGMTQEELAERAGLDKSYIGMLERGEKSPSLEAIGNLATCLGVSPDVLLVPVDGGESDSNIPRIILALRQMESKGRATTIEKIADLCEQLTKES